MATTIKLGTLYMQNSPVLFNTETTVEYIPNTTLEIREAIVDTNYNIEFLVIDSSAKHYLLSTRNILKVIQIYKNKF